MFITAYASRFHGNLLLRSEALASVVALYAGKSSCGLYDSNAWWLKKVVVWFVSLCELNYMCYPMFSGRSSSRLYPWNKSYLTIVCQQKKSGFLCKTTPKWPRFSPQNASTEVWCVWKWAPRMPRIRILMENNGNYMISGSLFCTTRPQVIESFSIKSANLYRDTSLHLSCF